MDPKASIVQMLLQWQRDDEVIRTKELCTRLGIPYAPSSDETRHTLMWAGIGLQLSKKEREFTRQRKRGRPKGPSKESEDQLIAEIVEEVASLHGRDPTDNELIRKAVALSKEYGRLPDRSQGAHEKRVKTLLRARLSELRRRDGTRTEEK